MVSGSIEMRSMSHPLLVVCADLPMAFAWHCQAPSQSDCITYMQSQTQTFQVLEYGSELGPVPQESSLK